MKSKFKSGDKLWATAYLAERMVYPVEIIMAAKTKAELKSVLDALRYEYDPASFRQVTLKDCSKAKLKVTPDMVEHYQQEIKKHDL